MCLSRWVTGSLIDISSFALVSIRIKEISTYVHHYPIMQSLCFLSQHRLRTVRPREHFQWVNFAFRQVSFKQHPWSRIFPSEIIHGDCKFNWGWKSYNHKELCSASVLGAAQDIFISTLDIPLSIIAFVGNILIIVALQKVSSLYPPSKHLLGRLASTDLGVGLIHIPYEVESICLEITRRTGTTSGSFLSSRVCCLAAYLY